MALEVVSQPINGCAAQVKGQILNVKRIQVRAWVSFILTALLDRAGTDHTDESSHVDERLGRSRVCLVR